MRAGEGGCPARRPAPLHGPETPGDGLEVTAPDNVQGLVGPTVSVT